MCRCGKEGGELEVFVLAADADRESICLGDSSSSENLRPNGQFWTIVIENLDSSSAVGGVQVPNRGLQYL